MGLSYAEIVSMPPTSIEEKAASFVTDGALTPAMRQYRAAKDAYPDTLLFFRMGDFYELFFEDAVLASRELQLTLTARDKQRAVPMCGVPYHAAESYLQRLLRRGYRVAICEQMEDPKLAKGVVRREVTRVLSPGTVVDPALDAGESCWLAAVATLGARAGASTVGVAFLDLSTGDFRATEYTGEAGWAHALDELGRMRPIELLSSDATSLGGRSAPALPLGTPDAEAAGRAKGPGRPAPGERAAAAEGLEFVRTHSVLEAYLFHPEHAVPLLLRHLGVQSLDGMGLAGHDAAAGAAGAILEYLLRTRQGALEHVDRIRFYDRSGSLELDAVTVRNLELVDPLFAADGPGTTLLSAMDGSLTPMGRRLLRSTLLRPADDLAHIDARLDAVAEAVSDLRRREELRRALEGVLDLERLLARVALDSAGPRELLALARVLTRLPAIAMAAAAFTGARWQALATEFDPLDDVCGTILAGLVEEPPVHLADGGAMRAGISRELDELRSLGNDGRQAVAAIEERERARTGIASLKVRFNNVFGYYLEVTRTHARSVPADYERKQTLVNAERFTTPELKDLETRILQAQERALELERALFAELRRTVLGAAGRLRGTAARVAEIDLLQSHAHQAAHHGWVRPAVDTSGTLEIAAGRHPVVERRLEQMGAGRFVPNSLSLFAHAPEVATEVNEGPVGEEQHGPAGHSIALITGPNMGGKSTYLRMAALLVVMAQAGSFVPATTMRLGLVDRIFTRIGASDNVARGRSTFMVEMTETAAILNLATERSLVLLDEMGRGTATFDGLSLAWAAVEFLHEKLGARVLFATHYHELTLLAEQLPRLVNLRVTVAETGGNIVFLHAVESGAASKSYGIEVARLAGLPQSVIRRAREVLAVHERAETVQVRNERTRAAGAASAAALQMTMFTPLSQRIVDRLGTLDVDSMTPREALALLAELQSELQG